MEKLKWRENTSKWKVEGSKAEKNVKSQSFEALNLWMRDDSYS